MEKPKRISELCSEKKENEKQTNKNEEALIKNCSKINLLNSPFHNEKEFLLCGNKCNGFKQLKKYEKELKEVLEANSNLKKINEVLINSLNLKDNMYLELLNKNRSLKADINFLQHQLASKNKFHLTNENFNCNNNINKTNFENHNDSSIYNNIISYSNSNSNYLNNIEQSYFSGNESNCIGVNKNNKLNNAFLLKNQNNSNLTYYYRLPYRKTNENISDFNNLIANLPSGKFFNSNETPNFNNFNNNDNKNKKFNNIKNKNNNKNVELCLFNEKLKKQKNENIANLFNKTAHTRHWSLSNLASNINHSNSRNIRNNNDIINNDNFSNYSNKSSGTSTFNFRNKSNQTFSAQNTKVKKEKVKLNEVNFNRINIKNINVQPFIINNPNNNRKNYRNVENEFLDNKKICNYENNDLRSNVSISPEREVKEKKENQNNYNYYNIDINENQSFLSNLKKEYAFSIAEEVEFNPTNKCLIAAADFDSPESKKSKLHLLNSNGKSKNQLLNNLDNNAIKNSNIVLNKSIDNESNVINYNQHQQQQLLDNSFAFANNKILKKFIIEEKEKEKLYSSKIQKSKKENETDKNNNSNNEIYFTINNIKTSINNNNNNKSSYYEKLSNLNSKNCGFRVYSNPEKSLLSLSEEEMHHLTANSEFTTARKTAANFEQFIEMFKENSEKTLMQISDKFFSIICDFEAAVGLIKKLKKFFVFISQQSNFLLMEEIADLIISSVLEIFECETARIYMFDSITNIFQVFDSSSNENNKNSKNNFSNNFKFKRNLNFNLTQNTNNDNNNNKNNKNNKFQKKNEIISEIIEHGKILRINNSAKINEKFFKHENKTEEFTVKNMLFCPLKQTVASQSFGVLQLLNKQNSVFSNDDEELARLFSMQISRVLLNAKSNNESNSYLTKFKFLFSLQKKFESVKNVFELEAEIKSILATLFSCEYSQLVFYEENFTQSLFKISKNREIKKINKSIGIIGFVFANKEYFGTNSINDCQIFNNLTDIETGLTLLTYPIIIRNGVKAILQFSYNEKLAYFKKPKDMDEILIGYIVNECERWFVSNEGNIDHEEFKKAVQLDIINLEENEIIC